MNFLQLADKYLHERGMFPAQAAAVIEMAKVASPSMADRLTDGVEGYPDVIARLWLVTLNTCAIDWIDANLPQAWYRPMFAGDA
jgi:hypothetical protein